MNSGPSMTQVLNFFTGLLLMLTSYILNLIENTKDVNESLMWIYRLFPGFCLGHGLFEICTNSVISRQLQTEVKLLEWDIAGKDALFLYILAPTYFILTLLIDSLAHSPLAASWRHLDPAVERIDVQDDPDVAEEAKRVEDGHSTEDVVRLEKLRKVYRTPEGAPKVAVQSLSFGLALGECFAFLGTNGVAWRQSCFSWKITSPIPAKQKEKEEDFLESLERQAAARVTVGQQHEEIKQEAKKHWTEKVVPKLEKKREEEERLRRKVPRRPKANSSDAMSPKKLKFLQEEAQRRLEQQGMLSWRQSMDELVYRNLQRLQRSHDFKTDQLLSRIEETNARSQEIKDRRQNRHLEREAVMKESLIEKARVHEELRTMKVLPTPPENEEKEKESK
eukprot:g20477.t1